MKSKTRILVAVRKRSKDGKKIKVELFEFFDEEKAEKFYREINTSENMQALIASVESDKKPVKKKSGTK